MCSQRADYLVNLDEHLQIKGFLGSSTAMPLLTAAGRCPLIKWLLGLDFGARCANFFVTSLR